MLWGKGEGSQCERQMIYTGERGRKHVLEKGVVGLGGICTSAVSFAVIVVSFSFVSGWVGGLEFFFFSFLWFNVCPPPDAAAFKGDPSANEPTWLMAPSTRGCGCVSCASPCSGSCCAVRTAVFACRCFLSLLISFVSEAAL